MSLLAEIRRRKVVQAAAVYAAVVWLLIQVIGSVKEPLSLPSWTDTLVIVLAVAGLPLTLIVAWLFDFTPRGFTRTPEEPADPLPAAAHPPESPGGKSIAVLPFENMSMDPEQEYFGNGIAEEILNALAQVRGLHVAARTSSFYFKGKDVELQTIGEKLHVNHVLEGSVRKAGNRLRITAQLIEIKDGYHLWSETYDREMADIFGIQEEIARSVVKRLKVELGLAQDETIVTPGTSNAKAHSCYLRGRFFMNHMDRTRAEQAFEAFKEAVAIDPTYAAGYGGLARAILWRGMFQPSERREDFLRAAYARALELDPNQVDALGAKGYDLAVLQYDFAGATEVFEAGAALGLEHDLAFDLGLHLFVATLRGEELLKIASEAERHDPLSAIFKMVVGITLSWLGRYDEAIAKLKEALELEPHQPWPLVEVARNNIRLRRFAEASEFIDRLQLLMGADFEWVLYIRGFWHVSQGQRVEAQGVLERLKTLCQADTSPSTYTYHVGALSIDLGDIDAGMAWFERACDERHWFIPIAPVQFASNERVVGDRRFQALLKRMNLDAESLERLRRNSGRNSHAGQ